MRWWRRRTAGLAGFLLAAMVTGSVGTAAPSATAAACTGISTENTTWTAKNSPYTVCTPLGVGSGQTFTIDASDGAVEVRFTSGGQLSIADGGTFRTVNTTPTSQVTLTAAGTEEWAGITGSGTISLRHTTISHARAAIWNISAFGLAGSLTLRDSTLTNLGVGIRTERKDLRIENSRFSDIRGSAVNASGGEVRVTGTVIERASTEVHEAPVYVGATNPFAFTNNAIRNSGWGDGGSVALELSGFRGNVTTAVAGTVGSNNAIDAILLGGVVTADLTWRTPAKHTSDAPLGFYYAGLEFEPGTTLTIPRDGIVAGGDRGINLIGAHLDATAGGAVFTDVSDPDQPIRMCARAHGITAESCPTETSNGQIFLSDDEQGRPGTVAIERAALRHTMIGTANPEPNKPPRGQAGDPDTIVIRNSTIAVGGQSALFSDRPLRVTGTTFTGYQPLTATGPLTFTDNVVAGTQQGLYVTGSVPLVIERNRFTDMKSWALLAERADHLRLRDNTFIRSGLTQPDWGAPVILTDTSLHDVGGNMGEGNPLPGILLNGALPHDLTWQSPTQEGGLAPLGYIFGSLEIPAGVALTIPAGAKVVGTHLLNAYGGVIDATAGGAVFTSLGDDTYAPPCPGCDSDRWNGVAVSNGGTFRADRATIRQAEVGIQATRGTVDLTCSTITDNRTGVAATDSTLHVERSNLFRSDVDLQADGSTAADARRNWWGQPGGPRPGQVRTTNGGRADTADPLDSPSGCAPSPPTQPTGPAGPDAPGSTERRSPPPVTGRPAGGYWMATATGEVHGFGGAGHYGAGGATADLEPTPSGQGYWLLDPNGNARAHGDARLFGTRPALQPGEHAASLSATPTGKGYWVFTNRGRAIPFGDATFLGDVSTVKLNRPVLGSVATPSGRGYYMVASDGGIFAFGDAKFEGSMGATKLNAPVQSLVPDSDGKGYWLVASDGGIFAFDAPFKGSLGGVKLNKPVVGMVRYGDGYLMVGADGGIFNFSSLPFSGSLGDRPPAAPVVAVAALP